MVLDNLIDSLDYEKVGKQMYDLITELFPICRSITGNGIRETLQILQKHIPLEIHEVPTGTEVYDWKVPKEWNIQDAYVLDPGGKKIVDFGRSNLHVLNYSVPIRETVNLGTLKKHLYTLPAHPDWIPYKTSYYHENWGFCLSHNQFLWLEDGNYEVVIDSTLVEGHLTYGEYLLPGDTEEEILISTHACHPSLANDNLSGLCTTTFLAKHRAKFKSRYSYRFLFIPGTIGAITWLALNAKKTPKIRHGLVIAGVGDSGKMTYKKSRQGDAEIDRAAEMVLKYSGQEYDLLDFEPYGYDERQYCSPGFNLPIGRISRTPFGQYSEYHTSADNLEFVHSDCLGDSFGKIFSILDVLEKNHQYHNVKPMCEPQLGKRGLYNGIGENELAMLWVLNMSDAKNDLLDIAKRSGIEFKRISEAASRLVNAGLLKEQ